MNFFKTQNGFVNLDLVTYINTQKPHITIFQSPQYNNETGWEYDIMELNKEDSENLLRYLERKAVNSEQNREFF